jgi:hypothetical protein
LIGLISFAPGLLLIYFGMKDSDLGFVRSGYVWMFVVNGFFLIRMLLDPVMVRRPLLEPNLSVSGLTFTGISLLVFLMANVVSFNPAERLNPHERLEMLMSNPLMKEDAKNIQPSPGYAPFYKLASYSGKKVAPPQKSPSEDYRRQVSRATMARIVVILAHLAIVLGLVLVGYRHFDNIHTGVAIGTLYLLFFYTSQMTGQVDHVVPAAFLVWAFVAYRRPLVAGLFIGLASGTIYYPLFLLPLWCGFYWQRGVVRFILGVFVALGLMTVLLAFTAGNSETFFSQFQLMFGIRNPFKMTCLGFWEMHERWLRIPVLAAFVCLCGSLALWPPQRNLGTLMSCSAAVMIAVQFWHANQGGIYLAWFLPILLLTIFRPNLEDRIASSAVRDFRWPWRRTGKQIRVDA